jgi:hypothetical protein
MSDPYIKSRMYVAHRGKTYVDGSSIVEYRRYSDGSEESGVLMEGIKPHRVSERIAGLLNIAYSDGKQDAFAAPIEYVCRIGNVEIRQTFTDTVVSHFNGKIGASNGQ